MHPNPKEKATDLFITYRFLLSIPDAPLGERKDGIAIRCALVCCDEIITQLKRDTTPHEPETIDGELIGIRYWENVKSELTKQQ